MRQQSRYEDQDIDIDKEDKYLENQGGFQNYNSGHQGYNFGNASRNYTRDGKYDILPNIEQGNCLNRDGYKNNHSGVYVPPGRRERTIGHLVDLSWKIWWPRFFKRLNQ